MLSPKVKVTNKDGIRIVEPRGEFVGGEETDQLREALIVDAEGEAPYVLVDLEDVTYLNSTALGVLIAAHTHVSKRGGRIGLCDVSGSIENIFVITKLVLVFTIYDSLEDGLAKITMENPNGTSASSSAASNQ